MNYLGLQSIREDLGPDVMPQGRGHTHARILQRWLQYPSRQACWEQERRARYAASLVTRADAELVRGLVPAFCDPGVSGQCS